MVYSFSTRLDIEGTHWDACWREHPECAFVFVRRCLERPGTATVAEALEALEMVGKMLDSRTEMSEMLVRQSERAERLKAERDKLEAELDELVDFSERSAKGFLTLVRKRKAQTF